MSTEVIIYGVGSPLLPDYEESLARADLKICVAIENVPGTCWLTSGPPVIKHNSIPPTFLNTPFLVPIFTPGFRQLAAIEAKNVGFTHPLNLVDRTSSIPRALEVEHGLYINSGCSIGAGSQFKEYVTINRGANIGHHTCLEKFVSIGPGATIGSMVRINKGVFIGAGATVLPEITIGENAIVAAGAVVTQNVPPHSLVAGNPARIIKKDILGHKNLTVK